MKYSSGTIFNFPIPHLDDMIKKLEELQKTGEFFCGLFLRIRSMMKRIQRLVAIHRSFGMTFANIGARDPHLEASSAYTTFGEIHRKLEKFGYDLLNTLKPVSIQMLDKYRLKKFDQKRMFQLDTD